MGSNSSNGIFNNKFGNIKTKVDGFCFFISQMVLRSNEVKVNFEQLGLFKNVSILIDTYKGM